MRIVLLGPPGAGKGTQAKRLSKRLNLVHIATGDIFRWNVQHGTELGKLAKTYMDDGELVPDDVVTRMVVETIEQVKGGFMLDGFPRTIPQAMALEAQLQDMDRPLSAVVAFSIDEDVAVKRISGRRICSRCQTSFNAAFDPPRLEGVCDVCGGELLQRSDDREETVRRRLQVYQESTAPLLKFYSERGLLREIDAGGSEEEVTQRLVGVLTDLVPTG